MYVLRMDGCLLARSHRPCHRTRIELIQRVCVIMRGVLCACACPIVMIDCAYGGETVARCMTALRMCMLLACVYAACMCVCKCVCVSCMQGDDPRYLKASSCCKHYTACTYVLMC